MWEGRDMGGASYLEGLYDRAKRDDPGAWSELNAEMLPRLIHRLTALCQGRLPPWELEDISQVALETMTCHFSEIRGWPQAWTFTRNAARNLTLNRLRSLQNISLAGDYEPRAFNRVDPDSFGFVWETDFCDEMGKHLNGLSKPNTQVLFALIEISLLGKVTLEDLARKLELSVSTVQRRLRALKDYFSHRNLP
jgi:DNA-directed RNA polymerase specialized sigma24 family protein